MSNDELQNMLDKLDDPVSDAGFTQAVMQGLPPVRHPHLKMALLLIAFLLGCIVVAGLFPLDRFGSAVAIAFSTPWLSAVCTLTLSLLTWLWAKGGLSV